VGAFEYDTNPNTYFEYAAFADLTYHFTDRFDVQFGGRESRDEQSTVESTSFPGSDTIVIPRAEVSENSFTYLVTPRFRVSSDLMIYARVASGFRPGGPNPNATKLELPRTFKSDQTKNYEIGAKGDLLQHFLTYDASIYYIDWSHIQLQLNDAQGNGYFANGSRAKSQGVELSVTARPLTGLTIGAWASWDDAVLTEALPPASTVIGAPGDRLPNGARVSGNLAIDQEFTLAAGWRGFVGATTAYVGKRFDVFTATGERTVFPAYTKVDLRVGAKYEAWTFNAFLNNATDQRGVLSSGLNPSLVDYIQPRTVGVSVARTF
jgi:iron complex outermembrane receptor protein